MYIHYGTKTINRSFDYSLSEERKNFLTTCLNKPNGLWASPKDAKISWENFVKDDYRDMKNTLKRYSLFSVNSDANILVIDSVKKLKKAFFLVFEVL